MRNYVVNGAFDIWSTRSGTTTSVAAWVAGRWLIGPGLNGVVEWSINDFTNTDIPGNPRHYLTIKWLQTPSQGENPPDPRWTFIENHGLRDARQLQDCFVDVTWWVRVKSGTVPVTPIIWHNFHDGDYQIYSGESYPIRQEKGWHPLTQTIYIPKIVGKVIDTTSYVGFGLDMITQSGPTLDIACVSAKKTTVDLIDPQIERVRVNGQFWN